ncbi:monofunctional biosynthetic peptidoglycan transglycosylase [Pseudochelatococcus lubricantis]|uniref:monofunctional biosynthetic peptidoglycan transglycosylase n=1 Tax=Pseudochelatococcus lubricantis TaxID=1538102 RepID=UPI0014206572
MARGETATRKETVTPRRKTRPAATGGRLRRVLRWLVLAGLATAAVPLLLLLLYGVVPPVSTLMLGRWLTLQPAEREWVALADIAPALPQAVIASEDSRFCLHGGVDWGALRQVIGDAGDDGPARGASTIPMQTVKNLVLWPGRSYVRKGLEVPLALYADAIWSKRRMMENYLNIAEWGVGIFGAEAAARRYFGKSARNLTRREAALLATALPNPRQRDPARPARFHARAANAVIARMPNEDAGCL